MPPTSTDTRGGVRRRLTARLGMTLLAAAVAVPVAGAALLRNGSRSGPTLRSATLAATDDADRLARDRASRSAVREEELPAPAPPDAPASRTAAAVTPVEVTQVTEERVIPVPKELHDDPTLAKGETRVDADGSPGLMRVLVEVTRRDGRIIHRRELSSEIITTAMPRVIFVGRGGGRGAPTDDVDADLPLKLQLAAEDGPGGGSGPAPARRFAASDAPATSGQQEGGASWYHYKPGTCAHRSLPKGTVVKVTNLVTGQSATCTVADRGPFVAGRIIDLDRSVFLAIAESNQGVVRVRIEW